MNKDFQEFRRQYSVRERSQVEIMNDMKRNLTQRNGGRDEYKFNYTENGTIMYISKCNVNELFRIDGDMNPQGL